MYQLLDNVVTRVGDSMVSEYGRNVPRGVIVVTCTKGIMGSGQSSVFIPGVCVKDDGEGKQVLKAMAKKKEKKQK